MIIINKEDVLNEIKDYYINSRDYNGLPVYNMTNYSYNYLCELIDDGLIEVLNESDVLNPHIKGFKITTNAEKQKSYVSSQDEHSVIYPTQKALMSIPKDPSSPYSTMMQEGCEQFHITYFSIEILERYVNNPKYLIIDYGYRGSIYLQDEYCEDISDYEYVKNYGMSYIEGDKLQRAIGVFVYDLAKLSSSVQMMWKSFELADQDKCKVHAGFVKNLLFGEWVTDVWSLHAILDEMRVINMLCDAINIPHIFNRIYGYNDPFDTLNGYRNIFLPTKKNYYNFVSVLEKLLIHNISYKAFISKGLLVKPIERMDNDGKQKGTLLLLSEWLKTNTTVNPEDIDEQIIDPLREIRKIRQIPAHELSSNDYNLDYYEMQFEIIGKALNAIAGIRFILKKNPYTKDVEIPKYLDDISSIVNY